MSLPNNTFRVCFGPFVGILCGPDSAGSPDAVIHFVLIDLLSMGISSYLKPAATFRASVALKIENKRSGIISERQGNISIALKPATLVKTEAIQSQTFPIS